MVKSSATSGKWDIWPLLLETNSRHSLQKILENESNEVEDAEEPAGVHIGDMTMTVYYSKPGCDVRRYIRMPGSNTKLHNAMHLYESVGFQHVAPEGEAKYAIFPANVFMEKRLK